MEYRKCSGMGGVSVTGHVSTWYVWSSGNVVVLVEFWYQECQHLTCMELRKCSGIGRVLVPANVSMWHMEYRKCSGMGGVSVTGHVNTWYVWSTGNVVVWVEFWYKEMSACGMYGAQEM